MYIIWKIQGQRSYGKSLAQGNVTVAELYSCFKKHFPVLKLIGKQS